LAPNLSLKRPDKYLLVAKCGLNDVQYRKLFGGGMRQAGYLAACGIYAIDNNWKRSVFFLQVLNLNCRMQEDHDNAKALQKGLVLIGFEVVEPQTNMVYADSKKLNLDWETIIERIATLEDGGEKVLIEGSGYEARIVLHLQTPLEAVQRLLHVLEKVVQQK
jgi:threonine aldolase